MWVLWHAIPKAWRLQTLRWGMRRRWPRQVLRGIERTVFSPAVAWVTFVVCFSVWHLPALYDLALSNNTIHALEHMVFLGSALLLWGQVIPAGPWQRPMGYLSGAIYMLSIGMYSGLRALRWTCPACWSSPWRSPSCWASGCVTMNSKIEPPGTLKRRLTLTRKALNRAS